VTSARFILVTPQPADDVLYSHLSAPMGSSAGAEWQSPRADTLRCFSSSRELDVVVMSHSLQAMYPVCTLLQPPWGVRLGWSDRVLERLACAVSLSSI
jgi:hypothetical protein